MEAIVQLQVELDANGEEPATCGGNGRPQLHDVLLCDWGRRCQTDRHVPASLCAFPTRMVVHCGLALARPPMLQ